MKKILGLLLFTSSIFSMRLDIMKSPAKVKMIQEKFIKQMNNLNKSHTEPTPIFTSHELESSKVRIEPRSVFVPHQLGEVELYHDKKGFSVIQNDKKHEIKKCFTDSMVRNIKKEDLKSFLKSGYLSLNEMSDGNFSLKATGRLNGGGVGGAVTGFYAGRFLVHFIAHGTIGVISLCTGPAAFATAAALEGCLFPHIVAAAEVGALTGGMIGAVATGPI